MDGEQTGLAARFGEASKLLPVCAVLTVVVVVYVNYVYLHCMRLLQLDMPEALRKPEDAQRGTHEVVAFHALTGMVLYCMARTVLTYPGTVPDGLGWELKPDVEDSEGGGDDKKADLVEKKHTGERRHCKWCLKYKPDRCHHCRICNVCVLRMDHHCPWVYNCIGFRNHKYFFLLLVYAVIDLIVVMITMFDTVWWSTRIDVPVSMMIGLMLAQTLSAFLVVLITSFLSFHIWLLTKAMTTVEFCEKSLKKASYNSSQYSHGLYNNICAVLGPNPVLWFLPIGLPQGDGLIWDPPKGSKASSSGDGEKASGPRASLLEKDGDGNGAQHESASASAAAGEEEASSGAGPARGSSRKARGGASRSKPQAAG